MTVRLGRRRRAGAAVAALGLATLSLVTGPLALAATGSSVTLSKTVTRVHLVDGADQPVESKDFSVTADVTRDLRDRQGINMTWRGAHPTGGYYFDANSQYAGFAEYPVVILQCRGTAATITPESCFTPTADTRYQPPYRGDFPAYRVDRYATAAERQREVGVPNPIPDSCPQPDGFDAERWVSFVSVDKQRYYGGLNGCGGLAPEQSVLQNPLNPSNATFGHTLPDGSGSARFIVQDAEDNASLGCASGVACGLVVIPIMGISCDASASSLPAADRPKKPADAFKECSKTGFYAPDTRTSNQTSSDTNAQTAVIGNLWWSGSNWRNRLTIPITFAQSAAACDVIGGGTPGNIYGSEYALQLTQQWAPTFCSDRSLFRLQHTQTSEVQAKNLLATGVTGGQYLGVKAAFQALPPPTAFSNPVVQAPTALSGFGIGFVLDDAKNHEVTHLRLNARLLAKMLSMSYPALPALRDDWAKDGSGYQNLAHNPLDVAQDPEFKALNPDAVTPNINQIFASSTLFSLSSDSDVITALTSYINADPDARDWLNGVPDPWGMQVNPHYKKLSLPVTSWPILDTYYFPNNNACIQDDHLPILPLVSGPVSDPTQIVFNMQLGISNSQTNCVVTGETDSKGNRRLQGEGREQPGIRFLLGVVGLADAARYQINLAQLQTQSTSTSDEPFTDASGRSFAGPTTANLLAAAKLMKPDDTVGGWTMPYDQLRTSPAGRAAYPGTLLISTDVPTKGLPATDAHRYAAFLDYAAGRGQVQGSENGQLPAGYVPITKAAGLGNLLTYTKLSAQAVRAQDGYVPTPSDPKPAPVVTTPPTTAPTTAPTATTPTQPAVAPSLGPVAQPTTSVPGPSVAPSQAPAPVILAGTTKGVTPGTGSGILGLLLVVGVACGGLALVTSRVGR